MKICKQCQVEKPDTMDICEVCGTELETVAAEPEIAEDAVKETVDDIAKEIPAEQPVVKKKSEWLPITIIAVLSVALVISVFFAVKNLINRFDDRQEPSVSEPSEPAQPSEPSEPAEPEIPADEPGEDAEQAPEAEPVEILSNGHHTNAYGLPSHSIYFETAEDGTISYSYMNEAGETVSLTKEEVDALMTQEVASCEGMTLGNDLLMYFYDDQYYSFQNTYSDYLSWLLNTAQALDEQVSTDGGNTWEQSFINGAVRMFQQMSAIEALAGAEGYMLPEEEQANVDRAVADLNEIGQSYGFADGDAYLQAYFGPYASLENYLKFYEKNIYVNSYLSNLEANMTYTDEELDAFYDENEAMLSSYGVYKTDKNVINIRHILIQPAASYADDGTTTYSDEAWADAEAEAQRIYDEWLAGEATEEEFAALAEQYTQDPGSMTTGGLYEEVFPGQMVTEFNDWCFADGRTVGDHGIVKTSYGYHIMFFSGEGDYIYWRQATGDYLRMYKVDQLVLEKTDEAALTVDLDKAILLSRTAPTAPAAEEEAE